jgi:hypothetical protein
METTRRISILRLIFFMYKESGFQYVQSHFESIKITLNSSLNISQRDDLEWGLTTPIWRPFVTGTDLVTGFDSWQYRGIVLGRYKLMYSIYKKNVFVMWDTGRSNFNNQININQWFPKCGQQATENLHGLAKSPQHYFCLLVSWNVIYWSYLIFYFKILTGLMAWQLF